MPDNFNLQGKPLSAKGLTGAIHIPLHPVKTNPLPVVILHCLKPDDFTCQGRASGWERVNKKNNKVQLLTSKTLAVIPVRCQ